MCGIFGSVFGGDVDTAAALEVLHHRGPDASGAFKATDVVFGHTRLAVIDLSDSAAQPMLSGDGGAVVVFNGEIYNHHALRRALEAKGGRFRSRSDTEVIVEGYRIEGETFFEKLDGMFAIALFDLQKRTLFLVRDRVGKKPLFYAARRGALIFASEVRALFAAGVAAIPNANALPMLLTLGYTPPAHTLYQGVSQLAPASILKLVQGREPTIRRYWEAPFDRTPRRISEQAARSDLRRLLDAAVVRRLEADVPLGAFLSGGIDSTIIVGLMARHLPGRLKTFSIGFRDDPQFDESPFARLVATRFGTQHTEFTLEPSAIELLDRLVEVHDGPFGDSSALPTAVVSMLARREVTVALTGDGGDELFAGYPRFVGASMAGHVPMRVRKTLRHIVRRLPRLKRLRRAHRLAETAALPVPQMMLRWLAYIDDVSPLLHADLVATIETESARQWARAVRRERAFATPLAEALSFNFETYLPHDLLVKADRTSMLFGLELRSPFLDSQLVEFAASLPDAYRLRFTQTKWLLRHAFEELLPPVVAERPKVGFGMPLARWFRTSLREFVHDTLSPSATMQGLIDMRYVQHLLQTHDDGSENHEHLIWLLLTLERWLRLLPSWTSVPPFLDATKRS